MRYDVRIGCEQLFRLTLDFGVVQEPEPEDDAETTTEDTLAPLPTAPSAQNRSGQPKRRFSVSLQRDAELEDFLQQIEQDEPDSAEDAGSVTVTVPPSVSAGEVLYVGTPDGREIVVEIPAGCVAGDEIEVDVGEGALTVEDWEEQAAAAAAEAMAPDVAAERIQAAFRGYRTRRELGTQRQPERRFSSPERDSSDSHAEADDALAPLPTAPSSQNRSDQPKRRFSVSLQRDAELEDFLQQIEQEAQDDAQDADSVTVTVPPNVSAGQVLFVGTPDGREIVVEVPAGCVAGDEIEVDVGEGALTVDDWEEQAAAAAAWAAKHAG